VEQRVLVTVKDAICFMKTWGNPRLAEVAPVDREAHARWAGRAAAQPQSKLRCGGGERATVGTAVLESMDPIKLDAVVYPLEQPAALISALNSPHDKSADKRQSLETKPISRGTESSNPPPSSAESANHRFRSNL
jgi:hypothetical protein